MWKIEKIISKGDYNYALVKGHPNATKNGYVLEHRVIMENILGRLLDPKNEIVHHKNGNKKDNRPENLELMLNTAHSKHHAKLGRTYLRLRCPFCGTIFMREKRNTHIGAKRKQNKYGTFCSTSCAGKFGNAASRIGLTPEMKQAISVNIVAELIVADDDTEQTTDNGMRRGHTPAT